MLLLALRQLLSVPVAVVVVVVVVVVNSCCSCCHSAHNRWQPQFGGPPQPHVPHLAYSLTARRPLPASTANAARATERH